MPVVQHFPLFSEEAQTGFEPVNQGVADPRLTTWLLRLIYRRYISSLLMYLLNYTRIRRFRQLFFFIKRYGSHSAREPETVF